MISPESLHFLSAVAGAVSLSLFVTELTVGLVSKAPRLLFERKNNTAKAEALAEVWFGKSAGRMPGSALELESFGEFDSITITTITQALRNADLGYRWFALAAQIVTCTTLPGRPTDKAYAGNSGARWIG